MIMRSSLRYSFSKYNRHRSRSIRVVILLSISIVIFMTIISSMDALQRKRFEGIKATRSFDIIVHDGNESDIRSLYPNAEVFSYKEEMALVSSHAMNIRYIDPLNYGGDVEFLSGDASTIAIPYTVYSGSGWKALSVASFSHDNGRKLPRNREVNPSGVYFSSAPGDFDRYYVLSDISNAPENLESIVAIKGTDDTRPLEKYSSNLDYETWKETESTLYSSFVLERTMMAIVISVLFLVVLLSLRQQIRTFLQNKRKERAELRILGLSEGKVNLIFTLSFLFVVILSLIIGAVLSVITIDIAGKVLSSSYGTAFEPVFDIPAFLIVASVMIVGTVLLTLSRLMRERKMELLEVIRNE